MSNWLAEYSSCNVGFELSKIQSSDSPYPEPLHGLLLQFIESCVDSNGPCTVPNLKKNEPVELIIVTAHPEQGVELQQIARAYFGSAYALVGNEIVYRSDNPAYSTLLRKWQGGLIRIRIPRLGHSPNTYRECVYQAMKLVLDLIRDYKSRPPTLSSIQRPIGRILRDFFISVRDYKERATWCHFDELQSSQAISAKNLAFLEIQANSEFSNWEQILGHPQIGDILLGRVPRGVTLAILKGIEALVVKEDDVTSLIPKQIAENLVGFEEFFLHSPDLDSSDACITAWRTWAIGAAVFGNFDGIRKIKGHLEESWYEILRNRFDFEDTDDYRTVDSLEALLRSPETVETALELVRSALGSSDGDFRKISNRLRTFPDSIIESLKKKQSALTLVIEGILGDVELQVGWKAWFDGASVLSDANSLLKQAITDSQYWEISTWNEAAFVDCLESECARSNGVLRNVLPILLSWLDNQGVVITSKTAELLLLDLAVDDVASIQDVSLAKDILTIALSQAHTKSSYRSMLEAVELLWSKVCSVHALGGFYELLYVVLDYPCSDNSSRDMLWHSLQDFLISNLPRLEPEARVIARSIAEELLGESEQLSFLHENQKNETNEQAVELAGQKLAIYSLMEKAAARAKQIIEELYPGLSVELNHDHNATSALLHLANSADYFVFSSRAASHQAFYPVTQKRKDIIYPDGKGTVSIVRAFRKTVERSF